MDCSVPGFPVHYLPEFVQTRVPGVSDAIQPSHPLSLPSPPALSLSQYQVFFFFPQIKMGAFHQPIFSIFGAALRGCGILVPQQESSPHPLYWKGRVLTTGPPDKSSNVFFLRDEQSVKTGAPHPGF